MRAVFAALALLLVGGSAVAQPTHGYAGGSFFLSTQGSHAQGTSPDLPHTGVGGTTWGVAGEIGGFLAPRFSVAFEYSLPARIDAVQEIDYFISSQTRSRYRDETMSFVARAYANAPGAVRVAIVGGGVFVRESAFQSYAYAPQLTRNFGPFGPETEVTRWTPGVTGGVDVQIAVAPHVSIVPQFRVTWVSRSDDTSQPMWLLGLDSFVLRGAVGVRATF